MFFGQGPIEWKKQTGAECPLEVLGRPPGAAAVARWALTSGTPAAVAAIPGSGTLDATGTRIYIVEVTINYKCCNVSTVSYSIVLSYKINEK